MKKSLFIGFWLLIAVGIQAAQVLSITNVDTWSASELTAYKGQEVMFPVPVYVNSTNDGLSVSVRRMMAGTETCLPASAEWKGYQSRNKAGLFQLNKAGSNHRLGEVVENLVVKVNSATDVDFVSGNWVANSRQQLSKGPDLSQLDIHGEHRLVVCAMNLEYYMVEDFQDDRGPANLAEHQKQRRKVSEALAKINADIYGLVEIQKGKNALKEIADDLHNNTGRDYKYVTLTATASGSFTQSAIVYCTNTLQELSPLVEVGGGPSDRRFLMEFKEISTEETFIYSINHFKAKSGSGSGKDADQHDGQGSFNASRTVEAQTVINSAARFSQSWTEPDILVMGDLNSYSMEDPIQLFIDNGWTNLHKYFHNNTSYTYTFSNEAGILDHALVNPSMLPQVTGVLAYHINSDESDWYTYDKSSDQTMFRSSDHDPVLVGLRLNSNPSINDVHLNNETIYFDGKEVIIYNARLNIEQPSYYTIFTPNGQVIEQGNITTNHFVIEHPTPPGLYIIQVYANNKVHNFKIIVE